MSVFTDAERIEDFIIRRSITGRKELAAYLESDMVMAELIRDDPDGSKARLIDRLIGRIRRKKGFDRPHGLDDGEQVDWGLLGIPTLPDGTPLGISGKD